MGKTRVSMPGTQVCDKCGKDDLPTAFFWLQARESHDGDRSPAHEVNLCKNCLEAAVSAIGFFEKFIGKS